MPVTRKSTPVCGPMAACDKLICSCVFAALMTSTMPAVAVGIPCGRRDLNMPGRDSSSICLPALCWCALYDLYFIQLRVGCFSRMCCSVGILTTSCFLYRLTAGAFLLMRTLLCFFAAVSATTAKLNATAATVAATGGSFSVGVSADCATATDANAAN